MKHCKLTAAKRSSENASAQRDNKREAPAAGAFRRYTKRCRFHSVVQEPSRQALSPLIRPQHRFARIRRKSTALCDRNLRTPRLRHRLAPPSRPRHLGVLLRQLLVLPRQLRRRRRRHGPAGGRPGGRARFRVERNDVSTPPPYGRGKGGGAGEGLRPAAPPSRRNFQDGGTGKTGAVGMATSDAPRAGSSLRGAAADKKLQGGAATPPGGKAPGGAGAILGQPLGC